MSTRSTGFTLATILGSLLALPAPASAQWYIAGYLGGTHTENATVSIREPGLALDFRDVHFYSLSTKPRRYYGLRLGRIGGQQRRIGFEIELIHMKALADTNRTYEVTAVDGTALPAGGASPMDRVVQEFQMTHGLNLALANLVLRRPLGNGGSGPVALMFRVGGGPTFPHAETTVNGGVVHHYEYGGLAAQGAAGVEIRLPYRASLLAEYKLTYARPELTTAHGTASTTVLANHISVGVGIALTR